MRSTEAVPRLIQRSRPGHRGQTLSEVLVAIAVLSVVVVFVTADLTNLQRVDTATDRSLESSAADFLLGVMKSDPGFWSDWSSGPNSNCLAPLGPYTDFGPSPSPNWHDMPTAPPGCPELPFTDPGGPQVFPSPGASAPPVGNTVQYMWNASSHNGDPSAADLTIWVRRDASSPIFEFHAIRYQYPGAAAPPTVSPGPTTPPPSTPPSPPTSPGPTRPPTPKPSPTPIGV